MLGHLTLVLSLLLILYSQGLTSRAESSLNDDSRVTTYTQSRGKIDTAMFREGIFKALGILKALSR